MPPTSLSRWRIILSVVVGAGVALALIRQPLTAPLPHTLHIADMTWIELRGAVERGYTSVIVPTGGIEQNGPHMVLGKHDRIVGWAAERIATEIGQTLVTPVVSFVPEGEYEPPTGNMKFPGTIGLPQPVFAQVLEGIARSLKRAGFRTICFLGDHGGNQAAQAEVAEKLSREWAGQSVRVLHVSDYYADAAQIALLTAQGETRSTIGDHAGLIDTSELLAVHPEGVDLGRLRDLPFSLEPAGHSGDPSRATAERGRALLALRITAAVAQIRQTAPTY